MLSNIRTILNSLQKYVFFYIFQNFYYIFLILDKVSLHF